MTRPKKQLNRRQEILDAARKLFSEKGIAKVTVQEIAEHAGIGKGTVYLDFKNKDDIHTAIVESYITGSLKELENVVKNTRPPYLKLLENLLKNDPLEIYDTAFFRMDTYAASMYTSFRLKQELIHLIEKWHGLVGLVMKKAAENGEIEPFEVYDKLVHLVHICFQGFFPPYALKYSPDYRTDLTKKEIRQLMEEDLSVIIKIILAGLQTVKYKETKEFTNSLKA